MAGSRLNLLGMVLFYPMTLYFFGGVNRIPRKLYTEVLADEGDDGNYVREMLRLRKPELWNRIAPQL